MVNRKTWEDFRNSGLLWFINTILHMFGWAIVFDIENDVIKDVYPARVKFRGFSEKSNSEGYIKVTKFLQDNINTLVEEAKD